MGTLGLSSGGECREFELFAVLLDLALKLPTQDHDLLGFRIFAAFLDDDHERAVEGQAAHQHEGRDEHEVLVVEPARRPGIPYFPGFPK